MENNPKKQVLDNQALYKSNGPGNKKFGMFKDLSKKSGEGFIISQDLLASRGGGWSGNCVWTWVLKLASTCRSVISKAKTVRSKNIIYNFV